MKTAKQKAISKEWKHLWEKVKDFVDKEGWFDNSISYDECITMGETKEIEMQYDCEFIRPLSLKGIENNNGWLDIIISDKLKKEEVWLTDMKTIWKGYLYTQFSNQRLNKNATHYQPIQKPLMPIY